MGPTRPPHVCETPVSYKPAYFPYPKNDKCKYLNLQSPVSAQNPASEEGRPQRKSETNKADSEGDKSDDKVWVDKKKIVLFSETMKMTNFSFCHVVANCQK